eukprot:6814540-Prymnesium_polylepis.1
MPSAQMDPIEVVGHVRARDVVHCEPAHSQTPCARPCAAHTSTCTRCNPFRASPRPGATSRGAHGTRLSNLGMVISSGIGATRSRRTDLV